METRYITRYMEKVILAFTLTLSIFDIYDITCSMYNMLIMYKLITRLIAYSLLALVAISPFGGIYFSWFFDRKKKAKLNQSAT